MSSRPLTLAAMSAVAVVGLFFHIWHLSDVPRGLYLDEASIGHNALLIAQHGTDEHGVHWPLFFAAFGEYKNPVYIYTTAALFSVFGPSEFILRFTSVLFFILLLAGLACLTQVMHRHPPTTFLMFCLALFLPWFFTLSRIAFEVISQVAVLVWALYFIYSTFQSSSPPRATWKNYLPAISGGFLIGLSTYTYSTARLLSFAVLVTTIILYTTTKSWRRVAVMTLAAGIALIPYGSFYLSHPNALTARFKSISYIYDTSRTTSDKLALFTTNYVAHFSESFLISTGDSNLRHATGQGGMISLTLLAAVVLGVIVVGTQKTIRDRFSMLVLVNLLLAPVAAALTNDGIPHALRSVLVPLYFLLLASYGSKFVATHTTRPLARGLLTLALVAAGAEATSYVHHYFTTYVPTSIVWFESYGFKDDLAKAVEQHPHRIIISEASNVPYILLAFYQELLKPPPTIPITLGPLQAQASTCLLSFDWNAPPSTPNNLTVTDLTTVDHLTQLRCYD